MKKCIILITMLAFIVSLGAIIDENHKLTQAHTIRTAYTLNKGEWIIGIGPLSYGINDNFEVGTDMLADIFMVLNAYGKYSIIDKSKIAVAASGTFIRFSIGNDNFNSIGIGGHVTVPLDEKMKLHTGANISIIPDFKIDDVEYEGGVGAGTEIPLEIEYMFNEHNVLLGGVAYDLTFKSYSVGVSYLLSWTKFNLQLGGSFTGGDGWTYLAPVIGIWWRF